MSDTPRKPRGYSVAQQERALTICAANAWSKAAAARETGIDRHTIHRWVAALTPEERDRYDERIREALAPQMERLLGKMVSRLEAEVDKIPVGQLAVSTGIVFDKVRLLNGLSTENSLIADFSRSPAEIAAEIASILKAARERSLAQKTDSSEVSE